MRKRKWTIAGTMLTVFFVALLAVTSQHETPRGQPPLADVSPQTLSQLKKQFNASPDSEHVILLLSPTCPVCVEGSSVVNEILRRHPANKVRVIAIWEPILPTDWNRPTTAVLERFSDERVVQWWDKQHVLAGQLRASFQGKPPGCCSRHETLWDVIAVFPPGAKWEENLPAPAFFAGPVVRGAPAWEAQLKKAS